MAVGESASGELRERIEKVIPCQTCEGTKVLAEPCIRCDEGEPACPCTCGEMECPACEGTGVESSVNVDAIEKLVEAELASLRSRLERAETLLKETYEYYAGPHACSNFTCSCNNTDVCGTCEMRERLQAALRGQK